MLHNDMLEKPDWVSPPGDTIISILEEREMSVEQFARKIGRTAKVAQGILDGSCTIDVELARSLAWALGASENFWMAREYDYRASVAEPEEVIVSSLPELLHKLPVSDMQKFGWIQKSRSKDEQISDCMAFFGVSTLAQWQGRYDDAFQNASFRKSDAFKSCRIATTAWLRRGEIETRHDLVNDWSPEILHEQIPHFRRLTCFKSPELFLPRLKELLAGAGVKFAVVRAPKGCSASGAVRVLPNGSPHIQLSFRYLSDDQFWFSLFHEVGHLLLHYDRMPILEGENGAEEETEREANLFAANTIVPIEFQEEMMSVRPEKKSILRFSKKIGIAPGLVVGQLQHQGRIKYSQMQHLKRRYRWEY